MTSSGTIWAEHYRGSLSELQQLRPEIESHVVASLAVQIPQNEVRIARRRAPGELDAWACFHLGLDHMYRFNRQDNARASELFTRSLERDPYFSGAMGGLSFTHFQSAFMRFAEDPEAEVEKARALAQRQRRGAKGIDVARRERFIVTNTAENSAHFSTNTVRGVGQNVE